MKKIIYVYLLIIYIYIYIYIYNELELRKLDVHITRNSSLICLSTIEGKKKSITLEFCIYKELELGKLEYCVAYGTRVYQARVPCDIFSLKIHVSTSFFMKFECLRLDLDNKLKFYELEFQIVALHIL